MSKMSILYMVLSILLGAYLVVGVTLADMQAVREKSMGLKVHLMNPANRFVKETDIYDQIKDVQGKIAGVPVYSIHLQDIEDKLNAFPNIEWANVTRYYSSDSAYINIDVKAVVPVARFIDSQGKSFYVNKDGKKLIANYKNHTDDVPIFIADLDSAQLVNTMAKLKPLLDYAKANAVFRDFATAFKIETNGDIILQPIVSNHVINLGDAQILDNKMKRLKVFYHDVVRVKGWEYYDTISVKWKGQVVATKRQKASLTPAFSQDEDSTDLLETQIDPVEAIPESEMTPTSKRKY